MENKTRKPRILLCGTGSVASIKIEELAKKLSEFADVKVALTKSSLHFVKTEELIKNKISVYLDEDEWKWTKISEPVLHIELRKWADVLLIAPLSANSLAKIANGLCDNLVTSVCRAWDFKNPFIVAPAMNTLMYQHPFTKKHLDVLTKELGVLVIDPIEKKLACGDVGIGALAKVDSIVQYVSDVCKKLEL